jgi:hypothetical protein
MRRCWVVPWSISAILAAASAAVAQTDTSLLFSEWKNSTHTEAQGDALIFPSAHLQDSGTFQLTEADASGRFRLSTNHELNPSLGYNLTMLNITGTRGAVPERLQDQSVAVATPLFAVDHGFIGALAGIGYAGDEAFGNGSAWYAKGDVMYGREIDKNSALLLFIDYDGNRTFLPDVPIPGIEYSNHANPALHYVLGFPEASVDFIPIEKLDISAVWDFLYTFTANVQYDLYRTVSLYFQYVDNQDAFHDVNLPDDRRLFFMEQHLELGIVFRPDDWIDLTLAGGYSFARSFSDGFDARSLHDTNGISDEPYARIGLSLRF